MDDNLDHLLKRLTIFLLVCLGSSVVEGKPASESWCFERMINSSLCSTKLQYGLPLDRYTCDKVKDIINCHMEAVECMEWMPWSEESYIEDEESFEREKVMGTLLFPEHNCNFLELSKPIDSTAWTLCSPEEELTINIQLDVCAGFLLSRAPRLLFQPCRAVKYFAKHCIARYMPRCAPRGSEAYAQLEAAQLANFLATLASELPESEVEISQKCGYLAKRKLMGKDGIRLIVPNITVNAFEDDPNERYFAQSWHILYERILDRTLYLPRSLLSVLSRQEFVELLEEDRLSQMMRPEQAKSYFRFVNNEVGETDGAQQNSNEDFL